jgi:hypothetical protein
MDMTSGNDGVYPIPALFSFYRGLLILDEGGWTLALGAGRGSPPVPTPDRLYTALTLAVESGLLGGFSSQGE